MIDLEVGIVAVNDVAMAIVPIVVCGVVGPSDENHLWMDNKHMDDVSKIAVPRHQLEVIKCQRTIQVDDILNNGDESNMDHVKDEVGMLAAASDKVKWNYGAIEHAIR